MIYFLQNIMPTLEKRYSNLPKQGTATWSLTVLLIPWEKQTIQLDSEA